jgi:hypothetical protein
MFHVYFLLVAIATGQPIGVVKSLEAFQVGFACQEAIPAQTKIIEDKIKERGGEGRFRIQAVACVSDEDIEKEKNKAPGNGND